MDDNKSQYTNRIKNEKATNYETKEMEQSLPEWIINLKNYFSKDTIQNNYPSYN